MGWMCESKAFFPWETSAGRFEKANLHCLLNSFLGLFRCNRRLARHKRIKIYCRIWIRELPCLPKFQLGQEAVMLTFGQHSLSGCAGLLAIPSSTSRPATHSSSMATICGPMVS